MYAILVNYKQKGLEGELKEQVKNELKGEKVRIIRESGFGHESVSDCQQYFSGFFRVEMVSVLPVDWSSEMDWEHSGYKGVQGVEQL